ncbi:MAG: hypothetical protein ACYDD1_06265 [Caulobacteraceae bacterium]
MADAHRPIKVALDQLVAGIQLCSLAQESNSAINRAAVQLLEPSGAKTSRLLRV